MNPALAKTYTIHDLSVSRKISDLLTEEFGKSFVVKYNKLRQARRSLLRNNWDLTSVNISRMDVSFWEQDINLLFSLIPKNAEIHSGDHIPFFIRLAEICCDAGRSEWAATILEPFRKQPPENVGGLLGEIFMLEGCVASRQQKWDLSRQYYSSAYDFFLERTDHTGMASALLQLGNVAMNQWDTTLCIEYLKDAGQNLMKNAPEQLRMEIQLSQAAIQLIRGDAERGWELLDDLRTRVVMKDNAALGASVLFYLGKANIDLREYEKAQNHLEKAFNIAETSQEGNLAALAALSLSETLVRLGKFTEAMGIISQAFISLATRYELSGLGVAYRIFGMLQREHDNLDRAGKYFEMGVSINAGINHLLNLCETYFEYSILAQQKGDSILRRQYLERSLYYAEEMRAVPRITLLQNHLETI